MTPDAAWVNEFSNTEVDYEMLAGALREEFENTADWDLEPDRLNREEAELAEELIMEKYSTDEWNFKK